RARHALHGLNVVLNAMFQQFPVVLGARQRDPGQADTRPGLLTTLDSMLAMADGETATIKLLSVERVGAGRLRVQVEVRNDTGHFLPSGVNFRRTFIELAVRDAQGEPVWISGATDALGVLRSGAGESAPLPGERLEPDPAAPDDICRQRIPASAVQPHFTCIDRQDAVQIYQEVVADASGGLTSSFVERFRTLKDNRLRPRGFDPLFFWKPTWFAERGDPGLPFVQALGALCGVGDDADYRDPQRAGADRLTYLIDLGSARDLRRAAAVTATLYHQSTPPPYLQQRFRDAHCGAQMRDDIERLYAIGARLNTEAPMGAAKKPALRGWKVRLASDRVAARRWREAAVDDKFTCAPPAAPGCVDPETLVAIEPVCPGPAPAVVE
ncbi:MAG: hypothetical protein KC620_14425, partial [Myxococcales bacterium]|nr:hypothetical protein [Myxococcales bacterium]